MITEGVCVFQVRMYTQRKTLLAYAVTIRPLWARDNRISFTSCAIDPSSALRVLEN